MNATSMELPWALRRHLTGHAEKTEIITVKAEAAVPETRKRTNEEMEMDKILMQIREAVANPENSPIKVFFSDDA